MIVFLHRCSFAIELHPEHDDHDEEHEGDEADDRQGDHQAFLLQRHAIIPTAIGQMIDTVDIEAHKW